MSDHGKEVFDIRDIVPEFRITGNDTFKSVLSLNREGISRNLALATAKGKIASVKTVDIQLLAPMTEDAVVIGVSKNFRDFMERIGGEIPDEPVLFAKLPNTAAGPDSKIKLPELSNQITYEAEVAVMIGREGKNIPVNEAASFIFGYTIFNDLTAFDLIGKDKNLFRAKNLDGFAPVGPWLVTADEISDPQNLSIKLWVNDELLQNSGTHQMIKTMTELISFISRDMTLKPGDIIATGSPAGTANHHNPPRFLKVGDMVKISIDGLGTLSNTME